MPILVAQIERLLIARGYTVMHQTTKKMALRKGSNRPIYLNLTSKSGVTGVVTHPALPAESIADHVAGAEVSSSYYHSSNMRLFPKRAHRGGTQIPYGRGITFDSEAAANAFLDKLEAADSVAGDRVQLSILSVKDLTRGTSQP